MKTRPAARTPDEPSEIGAGARRYKTFEETHLLLIETAVRLIAERGVDALSLAALARAAAVNRTTLYYHFKDRDTLVQAVKSWSAAQIVRAFRHDLPQAERIDHITRFVLENPEIMGLWIEDFMAPGDIRTSYPYWDELVAGVGQTLGEAADAEVFCVNLLAGALIGPLVLRNRVSPGSSDAEIIARYRREQQRCLAREGLLKL